MEILVRPESAAKPAIKNIEDRGVKLRVATLSVPEDELASTLSGVNILISAISAHAQLSQKNLARAAKLAGVERFVPCAYATITPPQGVMLFRDEVQFSQCLNRIVCANRSFY